MKTKTTTGPMRPQGKKGQRRPASHQSWGAARNRLALTASEGTNPANTLTVDLQPPEL